MGMKWTAVLAFVVLASVWSVSHAGKRKPNIIVILLDDLGYSDLGFQGSQDVKSPNIDKLMKQGVTFDNAYSCAGQCSPARAGVLTGMHPFRIGHHFNPPHDFEDTRAGIPHGVKTLPQSLGSAGYKSIAIGKWHLGFTFKHFPMLLGFDHFFGFLGGRFSYTKSVWRNQHIYDDWNKWDGVTYLTDDWTNRAMKFITKHRKEKFFMYLSYNTVHGPYQAKKQDLDPKVPRDRRVHVAMIKNLDDNIKRLRKRIAALGLTRDTVIVFTNDNGGSSAAKAVNLPLRNYKGSLRDGGVRVPFTITWPKTIVPNQRSSMLVSLIDIFPTCHAIAGRKSKVEGVNLLPFIHMKGNAAPKKPVMKGRCIFNRKHLGKGTVRQGDWKLFLRNNGQVKGLWNLAEDVGERRDVARKHPRVVKSLRAKFKKWDKKTKPAFFPASFGGSQKADNPVKLRLAESPSSVWVGQKFSFRVVGKHKKGEKLKYRWTVFEPDQETFVYYNDYKKHPGVVIASRLKKKTTIRFSKPGKLVVQIRAYDGRFLKIINTKYNVKGRNNAKAKKKKRK